MNGNRRAVVAAMTLALAGAASNVQAAFEGRLADFSASATCTASGPGKCTYFYDTTLDITILNDWNIGTGTWSASAAPGSAQALAASAGFAASGLSGWVLPTGSGAAPMGPLNQYMSIVANAGFNLAGLSNQFDGVQSGAYYWSSSEIVPGVVSYRVYFDQFGAGFLGGAQTDAFHAVAVRLGDIAAVPEPLTYAMMLTGLSVLMVAVKRQRA